MPNSTDTVRDDKQLVERARKGDRAAFRALVDRHQKRAFAVAFSMLRDREEALDVVQEAFIRVHQKLDTFDGQSQFFTWMYRIVSNLCIDAMRRRREVVELDERVHTEESVSAEDAAESAQTRARLQRAFDALSDAHREVLVLRELNGLDYKEIADAVGCPIGTVMSRLFHARKQMQAILRADEKPKGILKAA